MALGRIAARQRDQIGFTPIIQLPVPVGLGMVVQHAVQSPPAWPPRTTLNTSIGDRARPVRLPPPIIPQVNSRTASLRWIRANEIRRAASKMRTATPQ